MKKVITCLILFYAIEAFAQNTDRIRNDSKKYSLNAEQTTDIIYIYEEEKLAKDIYNEIVAKWNLRQFKNIAKSEQTHMDAVAAIAKKYSIILPAKKAGMFENNAIQELYDELYSRAMKSSDRAIQVGIDIEKLDIKDLETAISRANPDAKSVFENLKAGSLKHLAAFNSSHKR